MSVSTTLTDREALSRVQFFTDVPVGFPHGVARAIRRVLKAAKQSGTYRAALASWPDATWAVLVYGTDLAKPTDEQILSAYHRARTAGIRLFGTPRRSSSPSSGS